MSVEVKEKAWTVCKEFLGGAWMKISLEDFRFSEVKGGMSNTLYRCELPEDSEAGEVPKEALLRIYGPIQEDPNAVVTEAVTFMLLSERKLGPKLYGMFPKGRLEEFIPSHSLSSDELRRYAHLTARELAKIHALNVPVRRVPDIFEASVLKWLDEVQEILRNDNEKYFMSFDGYKEEIEWLKQEMPKSNSPVVYCHNDLQGGNVLYREDVNQNGNPKLMLIDFEFGSYNYRAFDFANHFSEWCFDYGTPDHPYFEMNFDKFPTEHEQTEFFAVYIDQLFKEGIRLERSLGREVESMLKNISLFACASHLLWSIWCAKMAITSSYGFAYREYGKTRRNLYRKFKEQCLSTK